MLQELKILNGKISLKFDPLNTKYTIIMNNNDNYLDMEYKIADTDKITIIGNDLINDYNEVIITVYNESESMNYYLYVYKEETTQVSTNINNLIGGESIIKEEVSEYAVPLISSICFLVITLLFAILFRKKKISKKI